MRYEQLIETISEIVNNEKINKDGLILTYEMLEELHKKTNEEIFYNLYKNSGEIVYSDIFEVEIANILIRFIKKQENA
jgi:hypothetical protein